MAAAAAAVALLLPGKGVVGISQGEAAPLIPKKKLEILC